MNRNNNTFNRIKLKSVINQKILFSIVISLMIIVATTPVVLGATEDSIIITFDPNGDIDIDVSNINYSFGGVVSETWTNTTGGTFTLYNNGTVAMDTQIKSNATTNEGNLTLDEDGSPPEDNYSFYTAGFDADGYITTTYAGNFDLNLVANDFKTFDLDLNLGNLSANHTTQTTTIYFQGSQV